MHHLTPSSPEHLPFKHRSPSAPLHLPYKPNHPTHPPPSHRRTKDSIAQECNELFWEAWRWHGLCWVSQGQALAV